MAPHSISEQLHWILSGLSQTSGTALALPHPHNPIIYLCLIINYLIRRFSRETACSFRQIQEDVDFDTALSSRQTQGKKPFQWNPLEQVGIKPLLINITSQNQHLLIQIPALQETSGDSRCVFQVSKEIHTGTETNGYPQEKWIFQVRPLECKQQGWNLRDDSSSLVPA